MARSHVGAGRRAFSLVEMMVALAVLVVAIAIVTNVFSISAKTASTAAAIGEVEANVQRFFSDLETDLAGIDPTQSVLVIDGVSQVAARTEELRQANRRWRVLTGNPANVPGAYNPETDTTVASAYPTNSPRDQYSDPRIDKLMFFTTAARSSRQPATAAAGGLSPFQRTLQDGASVSLVQCVYGHASFATPVRNGVDFVWPGPQNIRHVETRDAGQDPAVTISRIPAVQWVLGARRTLIEDVSAGESRIAGAAGHKPYPVFKDNAQWQNESGPGNFPDTWDRITRSYAVPGTQYAADAAMFRFSDFLTFFAPRVNASFLLLDPPAGLALANPYDLSTQRRWDTDNGATRQILDNILYYPDPRSVAHHHVVTLADVTAPELAANRAMAALPGCAWFQVEFLMPEDPRNSLVSPIGRQRDDMPRWVDVPAGDTYAFVPDTEENRQLVARQTRRTPFDDGTPLTGTEWDRLNTFAQVIPPSADGSNWQNPPGVLDRASNRRIRMWPYAIRVTVRVFDTGGKLQEPLVRTLIHRFDR